MKPLVLLITLAATACDGEPQENVAARGPAATEAVLPAQTLNSQPPEVVPMPEGQANLERLLMGYWREKLGLPDQRIADALTQLKAHGEAGELLRALERWLHQPGGAAVASEINSLLQPYRALPVPNPEGGRA